MGLSLSEFVKETGYGLSPFTSPSQFLEDKKLMKRLGKLQVDSGPTRSQIESLAGDRRRLGALSRAHEADVGNVGDELLSLRRSAASAAAQDPRVATTAGGTLDESLRRAKARQGIVDRGEAAIRSQQLVDRLRLAKAGVARQASAIDLQGAGQQIRAGVNLAGQNARDRISSARAGAAGGIAGSFAGILKGNRDNNGSFFDFGAKNA